MLPLLPCVSMRRIQSNLQQHPDVYDKDEVNVMELELELMEEQQQLEDEDENDDDDDDDSIAATTTATARSASNNSTASVVDANAEGDAADDEEDESPPSIPESTAYWSKAPYAWSTSLDYTPPLLTSSHCAAAVYNLFRNTYYYPQTGDPTAQPNFLLAVVTESSSHPAGLNAVFAQPWMYAGPGLGSIDECPLQTCLAGGRSTDTITFAAVCTVPECSAYDLAADDFVSTVARQLEAVVREAASSAPAEPPSEDARVRTSSTPPPSSWDAST